MMRDFANRNGGIAIAAKPSRHAGCNVLAFFDCLGSFKKCRVGTSTVRACQQRCPRSAARGGLDVVAREGRSNFGKPINVGRVDVIDPKAIELRPQVINTNQQHIRLVVAQTQRYWTSLEPSKSNWSQ